MKEIASKWYKILNFPTEFDAQFSELLNGSQYLENLSVETFDESKYSPEETLVYYLYFCENLEKKYQTAGIERAVLLDTLSDLVIWCKVHNSLTGKIGVAESSWVKRHLSFRLFKLGRLQFCMDEFSKDYDEIKVKKGESVLEIHIPETGKLDVNECEKSINRAKEFFSKYFPDFKYEYFSCHSWLLDETLKELLSENSNIIKFGNMFTKLDKDESYAILKYTFKWNTRRENLHNFISTSSFCEKIKTRIDNGGKFYQGFGIIKRI